MVSKQNTLLGFFCIITFLVGYIVGDISGIDQGNHIHEVLTINKKILEHLAAYKKSGDIPINKNLDNDLSVLSNRVDELHSLLLESKGVNGTKAIATHENSNVECLSRKKIEELVSVVLEKSSQNTSSHSAAHQSTLTEERKTEIDQLFDKGNAILSNVGTTGTWTNENRKNFNAVIQHLPGDKQAELLQAFSRKINSGEITVDSPGLPFGDDENH